MRSMSVVLEYLPTRDVVKINCGPGGAFRYKEQGIRVLRSKLASPKLEEHCYDYDLMDDEPYPNELLELRRKRF